MMIYVLDTTEKIVEKEKMLVTSIFSFSHNVFKSLPVQYHLKLGLCGKELNQPNRPCIYRQPAVRDHIYYFPWLVSEYRLYCIWFILCRERGHNATNRDY